MSASPPASPLLRAIRHLALGETLEASDVTAAFELVMAVAEGAIDVPEIAARLTQSSE